MAVLMKPTRTWPIEELLHGLRTRTITGLATSNPRAPTDEIEPRRLFTDGTVLRLPRAEAAGPLSKRRSDRNAALIAIASAFLNT
jgi:hypothetical protein